MIMTIDIRHQPINNKLIPDRDRDRDRDRE